MNLENVVHTSQSKLISNESLSELTKVCVSMTNLLAILEILSSVLTIYHKHAKSGWFEILFIHEIFKDFCFSLRSTNLSPPLFFEFFNVFNDILLLLLFQMNLHKTFSISLFSFLSMLGYTVIGYTKSELTKVLITSTFPVIVNFLRYHVSNTDFILTSGFS